MQFSLCVTYSDTKMRCSKYYFRILEILVSINSLDKAFTNIDNDLNVMLRIGILFYYSWNEWANIFGKYRFRHPKIGPYSNLFHWRKDSKEINLIFHIVHFFSEVVIHYNKYVGVNRSLSHINWANFDFNIVHERSI